MKIGKLPDSVLQRLIIEPVSNRGIKRKEVIIKPSIGEDCTAIDFGNDICLMSTDPITGAVEDIGRLAVYINTNDIAACGGTPIGIMVTALLPPNITEEQINKIISDLCESAAEVNIAVLGGHTEITDAVTKPVLSCTVVGKCKKIISSADAECGDTVIMTKYAAMEGTSIIAAEKAHLLSVSSQTIERAKSLGNKLSVIKEGNIGAENGVHAMHDITEGGVLGACWEVAACSGKGIEIDCSLIPILPETAEICHAANINPLKLISSGSMLMTTDNPQGLISALESSGIKAAAIGKITESGTYIIENGIRKRLDEPDTDELYKI